MVTLAPVQSVYSGRAMVAAPDHLAAQAGLAMLTAGGSAADAAVATSAVLAVTTPHLCGMGGDLWAVASHGSTRPGGTPAAGGESPGEKDPHTIPSGGPPVVALCAAGRAGSGADLQRLLADGHRSIPPHGHPAAVPVPGCVDGWVELHRRLGRLPLAQVLEPARQYASSGFPASPTLAAAIPTVAHLAGAEPLLDGGPPVPGALVRRTGVAEALEAIAADGRDGFYQGRFGRGLMELAGGEFTAADLAECQADWVEPLQIEAWGSTIWTVPPPSQGYLTLAGAWIAQGLDLPGDGHDPLWAHLLVEAARQAGHDRLDVLHESADGQALLAPSRLERRRRAIDPTRTSPLAGRYGNGDTIACLAATSDGDAVSLVQSNASGFGSGLIEPTTGIFLHNRGTGFSLDPTHPAAYGPHRRPPSTLCPTLVTDRAGRFSAAIGSMGGDRQPQILLQLLARLLQLGQLASEAVPAGRWGLSAPAGFAGLRPSGFDTWEAADRTVVAVEGQAPAGWAEGLTRLGHTIVRSDPYQGTFGHAHAIVVRDGVLEGSADPRTLGSGVAAL
ncbi:MAG: gamma-glutamyltransferase [Actinomycetota bacterium]|nr:gamma-glutamyltransferase [Actinomycetota bacterium]